MSPHTNADQTLEGGLAGEREERAEGVGGGGQVAVSLQLGGVGSASA